MVLFQNKNLLYQSPIILIVLSFLISYIYSQEIQKNITKIEMFNETLTKYNQSLLYFDDMSKKMEKITMNIVLKLKFKGLIRDKKSLEQDISKIKEKIDKKDNDNQTIIEDINSINQDIKYFNHKYNKINQLYNQYENVKESFSNFIKVFFIVLFIIVVIALSLIGIISFFVVKNQRKYYKLQEEVTISEGREENTNDKVDEKIRKINKCKESLNQSRNGRKIYIKSDNIVSSHDEMNKETLK